MRIIFKRMLLRAKGVRNEVTIAFGLIVLGILVFVGYLFPGVSTFFETKNSLHLVVAIILFMFFISFVIILQIIEPFLKISDEAKKIADGDLNREIELFREDEIGDLGVALNQLTHRIKSNLEELQNFKKATEDINSEINQRIDVLSNILGLSNLIAQNAPLKDVLEEAVRKCVEGGSMDLGCVVLKDRESSDFLISHLQGDHAGELIEMGLLNQKIRLGQGLLGKAALKSEVVVIDKSTPVTQEVGEFRDLFAVKNAVIIPISSKGNIYGLLVTGNVLDGFECSASEKELLQVIAKQIMIALTNERVASEIRKLEAVDNLTGLFNQAFIRNYLKSEIKKAMDFKKPCSFVLFSIDDYQGYFERFGNISAEDILVRIVAVLTEFISPTDKAGRFSDDKFAVILPGKNKRQSIEVAEKIRINVELLFSRENDKARKITCTGAVTENPLDGMSAEELISKAEEMLKGAEKQGGNKVLYKI